MRAGYWHGRAPEPFQAVAEWTGAEDMYSVLPGTVREMDLELGTVRFRRGVLFHPTRPRAQRLEPILILEKTSPDMFDYDCWEKLEGADELLLQAET